MVPLPFHLRVVLWRKGTVQYSDGIIRRRLRPKLKKQKKKRIIYKQLNGKKIASENRSLRSHSPPRHSSQSASVSQQRKSEGEEQLRRSQLKSTRTPEKTCPKILVMLATDTYVSMFLCQATPLTNLSDEPAV